jgi:ribokinase
MGAGDSFAAGFITAWIRSEKIEQALNMANAAAALTISKQGAQNGQPSLEELARFLRKHNISIDSVLNTFKTVSKHRKNR